MSGEDEIRQNITSTEKKGFNCLKNIVYMHLFFVYLLPWSHFFSPLKNKKLFTYTYIFIGFPNIDSVSAQLSIRLNSNRKFKQTFYNNKQKIENNRKLITTKCYFLFILQQANITTTYFKNRKFEFNHKSNKN